MKKNSTNICCAAILTIQFLAYSFRIDQDFIALQEYIEYPSCTATDQPFFRDRVYLLYTTPAVPQVSIHANSICTDEERTQIWKNILLSYNSLVDCLLKQRENYSNTTLNITLFLHNKIITPLSDDDEALIA